MKTFRAIALAFSSLIVASTVQAQERQTTIYSGPASIEPPVSMLRGSTLSTIAMGEASATRKVRVVLQSPYGN